MKHLAVLFLISLLYPNNIKSDVISPLSSVDTMSTSSARDAHISKYILDNGMTVLVRPVHTVPKVSIQMWYNVGSKDEKSGEKGIAHLIEHMIFKGTKSKKSLNLSESDINCVTHMLSGSCNAFTSYDYTGYLFNMPTQNWREMLPIMADCMQHARFDPQMLASEMKAVIQELKMYKDRYLMCMVEDLIAAIFPDHPYHYPIIGYKQDLWNANSELLHNFYKKHYWPNNATLVIVGDVDPEEVIKLANQHFAHLEPNKQYQKEVHYHNKDIASKSVTLYRDVQQPVALLACVVPGVSAKQDHIITALEWILGKGRGSRLYKKLVNELQLVTSLEVGSDSLFDYSLFFIAFEPKDDVSIETIEKHIFDELHDIATNGVTQQECERAAKQMRKTLYSMLEDMEQQAYAIGQYFVATGDEQYVFTSLEVNPEQLCNDIQNLVSDHFKSVLMHRGSVVPIPNDAKETWIALQEESDKLDEKIMSAHVRTTPVEPEQYAKTLSIKQPKQFVFPKPETYTLNNGLKVLVHHNDNTPKINVVLSLRARNYYDPDDKLGINNFMSSMLTEGTKSYTTEQFADVIESRGMSFAAYPGGFAISLLRDDLPFALEILNDVLTNAVFDKKNIEKVRTHILAEITNFWDEPRYFSGQLIKDQLYAGHPYSKNRLGTKESITSITRDDLVNYYKQYISPDGARIAIVGDIDEYNVQSIIQEKLDSWTGPAVEELKFPEIAAISLKEINYPINRDQIVLAFAKHSIDRNNNDYDKLLLFNQIFGGGALGSMSSRLFQLRERSGLFYTISGSLLVGADEQPGMFVVKTIVSRDRLSEAEDVIRKEINESANAITEQELEEAKRAVINSLVDNFSSNSSIANTFLYLDRFGLSTDYFDTRAQELNTLTVADVQQAVKGLMSAENMLTVRVGRVPGDITKIT